MGNGEAEGITVRVIFESSDETENLGVQDIKFPAIPRVGEALFFPEVKPAQPTWIVEHVGYRCDPVGAAQPMIQVTEFEPFEAPSGLYDRMIDGR